MTFDSRICKWDVLKSLQSSFLETLKVIAIYKGNTGDCALLLTYSGEVYAVGKSTVGCLGLGDTTETSVPLQLKEITGVKGVSLCGSNGDALAFTSEGKLYTWGTNSNEIPNKIPTVNLVLSDIVIVDAKCAAGNYVALAKDGKIYHWKGVAKYIVGGTANNSPTQISVNEKIIAITCGFYSSMALTKDGEIYRWGMEYNVTSGQYYYQPVCKITVSGESFVKMVCTCYHYLLLTTSGKIFTFGKNDWGLGHSTTGSFNYSQSCVVVGGLIGRFVDIAVNNNKTCAAITEFGVIYVWGYGGNKTPTSTYFTELHEVFATLSPSSFVLESKISVSIDVDGITGVAQKLKASFNNKESSDLTVIVDNKKIYLHRYMLNIRSEYFLTLLQDQWTNKNAREIELNSFDHEVYKSYFWYLYSGELKSPIENLLELWNLANAYNEDNLKFACEKLMRRNLPHKQMALQHCKTITKRYIDCTSSHEDSDEDFANLEEKLRQLEINQTKQQAKIEVLREKLQLQQNADKDEEYYLCYIQPISSSCN